MAPNLKISSGSPEPLGLTIDQGKANFSVFSSHAAKAVLYLFFGEKKEPELEIPMEGPYIGIWHIAIEGLPKGASYAYRFESKEECILKNPYLSDPYAKAYSSLYNWGDFSTPRLPFLCRCDPLPPFDWQGVAKPQIPLEDMVIYEMHIRGFTKDPSSGVRHPGTYLGAIEKIPHLKNLGVNAVELMPIFEFDETHMKTKNPKTGERLVNYWGYSPLSFFIPMSRFASDPSMAIQEFKTFVREMHRAGIEVLLDVVYNHTPEAPDYISSYRGIDRSSYYILDERGIDKNYSGCGNTFQTNTHIGSRLILDSLRYWTKDMQVDGFRFDLASILTRDSKGKPIANPPILKMIAKDPIIKGAKLIAEPWDAAGLYQVGQFPKWGSWSGWNGPYRDHVRRFLKGTDIQAGAFAAALCGSEPSYGPAHTPLSSINFITAHDGFSLIDLVSYQDKHNEENGEENRDGSNSNDSWNCGKEGETKDPAILNLREKQMRNFLLALFFSQGIPMLVMGDEIAHTRKGNNNPYAQDNEINWFNWNDCKKRSSQIEFISSLIAFRKRHAVLHRKEFLKSTDIDWHGAAPGHPDWGPSSRFVAFSLKDPKTPLYVAFHAGFVQMEITLPPPPAGKIWKEIVNTSLSWDQHSLNNPENGKPLETTVKMAPYSAMVAIAI